jgi:hypothetical protein
MDTYPKYLGSHELNGHMYKYFLYHNGYVYQEKDNRLVGVYCSFVAWERTMHKVLEK